MTGRGKVDPITRVCLSKKPYATLAAAEHASKLVNQHTGAKTRAFRCPICAEYHVGHSDRKRRNRKSGGTR